MLFQCSNFAFCVLAIAVLVAEVTQVSLGVGYEIGRAIAMKKPILCLYRPQSDKSMNVYLNEMKLTFSPFSGLSAMVRGAEDGDSVKVVDYEEEQLESILKDFFKNEH